MLSRAFDVVWPARVTELVWYAGSSYLNHNQHQSLPLATAANDGAIRFAARRSFDDPVGAELPETLPVFPRRLWRTVLK
jgi:hypothetical protein